MSEITPTPTQTQTWAAIVTAIAGAVAAVFAKKRFIRRKAAPVAKTPDYITRAEFHHALDSMRDRIDANHREVLSVIASLATTIEKRLDVLESAVARLDERTRN